MKITRIVKNKDGHVEATMMLTMEQVAYLINVGLLSMMQRGSLELEDLQAPMERQNMTPETFQGSERLGASSRPPRDMSVQEKQDAISERSGYLRRDAEESALFDVTVES